MIYVASPFSSPDAVVRWGRYERVTRYVAKLILAGHHAFSPITHAAPMAEIHGLGGSWEFWEAFDLDFLGRCDELRVLKLEGWDSSRGVAAEIAFAEKHGMPIEYVEADGD